MARRCDGGGRCLWNLSYFPVCEAKEISICVNTEEGLFSATDREVEEAADAPIVILDDCEIIGLTRRNPIKSRALPC